MRPDARVLVIGPADFREEVGLALPRAQRVGAAQPLAGLWQLGQQSFDGVLVSLTGARESLRLVQSLREVAPEARIIVSCQAADEPGARRAVQHGADDYIIEPLTREDLERAFGLPTRLTAEQAPPPPEPSLAEKVQFVDVIKNLADGPQATLERMARLLARTFDARGVTIEIDGLVASVGRASKPVLEEPIRRQDATVGAIALGRRRRGGYGAAVAARLADYARLVEAVVTVAQERAHWQNLAWTDDLSRLRNRRYFERRLDELLERCAQERRQLTVLLLDIDDFKTYNDRFGHETGDALLREVAYLLTRCSRETDVVARFGGDEFAIIFWEAEKPRVPGSKHPDEPAAFSTRFLQAMQAHQFRCLGPNAPGEVTVSGGLATFPWDGRTREDLLRSADEALLTAKRTGKNQIRLAGDALAAEADSQEAEPPATNAGGRGQSGVGRPEATKPVAEPPGSETQKPGTP